MTNSACLAAFGKYWSILKKRIFQPSGHSYCCAKGSRQESHPVFLRGWHLKATVTGLARVLKRSERQRPHHLRRYTATPCESKLLMSVQVTESNWRNTPASKRHSLQACISPEGIGSTLLQSAFWDENEWQNWELGAGRGFVYDLNYWLVGQRGKQSLVYPGGQLKVRPSLFSISKRREETLVLGHFWYCYNQSPQLSVPLKLTFLHPLPMHPPPILLHSFLCVCFHTSE